MFEGACCTQAIVQHLQIYKFIKKKLQRLPKATLCFFILCLVFPLVAKKPPCVIQTNNKILSAPLMVTTFFCFYLRWKTSIWANLFNILEFGTFNFITWITSEMWVTKIIKRIPMFKKNPLWAEFYRHCTEGI